MQWIAVKVVMDSVDENFQLYFSVMKGAEEATDS